MLITPEPNQWDKTSNRMKWFVRVPAIAFACFAASLVAWLGGVAVYRCVVFVYERWLSEPW